MSASDAVIIVAKHPVPGSVKTRLCPPLTHQEAADLAAAFFLDTLDAARAVPDAEVVIGYSPGAEADRRWFAQIAAGHTLLPQGDGDLGQRLLNLLNLGHRLGYQRIALIGSDMPHIDPAAIRTALDSVRESGGAAIGPAMDGGYYLLALDRVIEPLFQDMPWGESILLDQTLRAAGALNLDVHLLPFGNDIDEADDLRWLAGDPIRHRLHHTNQLLSKLLPLPPEG